MLQSVCFILISDGEKINFKGVELILT